MSVFPLYRVRLDGTVERLGAWNHDARRLDLSAEGFPFLPPGSHQLEGELPWLFWDMCPSGFLGRRLVRGHAELRLAADPRDWSASDVVSVLTQAGSDLAGNLLVGERAVEEFRRWQFDPRGAGALLDDV
ncbi:MAG TPA: hypothetical protein VGD87_09430, partial [Archangium sp.]